MSLRARRAGLRVRPLAAALGVAVLVAGAWGLASGHGKEPLDEFPEDVEFASAISCQGGAAGGFDCANVDLVSWLPLPEFDLGQGNDIWGWIDTRTGHEYAIMGFLRGVAFVDLGDPTDPVIVGSLPTATQSSIWNDIRVYQDHAFIVSEAPNHGMQIFDLTGLADVTDPPVTFAATARYRGFGNAHNVVIDEESGFAYAVGTQTCNGGLHAVDVRDPLNPVFAGCFSADGYTHDAHCLTYDGPDPEHRGREICLNSNENTLTIVDVTDKAAPVMLSRTGYAGRVYTHQGTLTEDQAHFLIDDELDERVFGHSTRTWVWDVRDLDAPFLIGHHDGVSASIDHNQFVRGSHVFQANYRSGLRILRMGNLDHLELTEVAYFDTFPANDFPFFTGAWGVYPYLASGVVLVSDIARGLFVLAPDLTAVPECGDGLDNDLDGFIDFPADLGCFASLGRLEAPRHDVAIDIRPSSSGNPLNPMSNGVIPVALLGSATFDVAEVDPATLRFGPAEAPLAHRDGPHEGDSNADGLADLLGHYQTAETGIAFGDSLACLRWETRDGTAYEGCDRVWTGVGCGAGPGAAAAMAPLLWIAARRRRR